MHSESFRSKTSWNRCKKHPGHKQFIPIRNLTCDMLPEPYRSDSLYNFICFAADLTVCLRVKRVSSKRPSEYVFSSFRGKNTTHTGSGFVFHVGNMRDASTLCDCSECKDQTSGFTSAKPQDICPQTAGSKTPTLRAEVFIRTAAHVVFDNEEAKSTFIDVFYDDENDRQNSRLMRGYCIVSVDMENDISVIKCLTHDQTMSDRLRNSLENLEKLQNKAFSSFEPSAKLIEPNLQGTSGNAVKGHFHLKSKTSKPIAETNNYVESKPLVVCDKSVKLQPLVACDKSVTLQHIIECDQSVILQHIVGCDQSVTFQPIVECDKSITLQPIVTCDKFVTLQPIVTCDKFVTSQPSVLFDNFLETQLHGSSSKEINRAADLFHKYHHCKSERKLKETDDYDDDDKRMEKYFNFMMTDIVRSVKSKDNMRADNSEEAEMENLEISIQFPDGEKSLHNIWLFDEPVKASKEFLLNQANVKAVPPDLLVMVIKYSDKPDIIMSDHLDMQSYINDLTEAEYIEITWKDVVDDCHLLN